MKRSSLAVLRVTEWNLARCVLLAACLAGVAACRVPQPPSLAASYEAQFDALWSQYDQVYPAFRYKNVTPSDWNDMRTRYRPQASAARTDDEFIAVMLDMLKPLRDVHAWFVDPKGTIVPTYVPTALENFDRGRWSRALRDAGWIPHGNAWGEAIVGGFAYLYIETWSAGQIDTLALDAALLRHRDAPGMIIDVRTNAGGSDAAAFAFASRFATRSQIVSYVQERNGTNHDDLTPVKARTIGPRGTWQYTKPVVVLAGRGGFSANESFVAAMREMQHVTVIGDTTGGASGNPGTFPLGNGWSFTVPQWFELGPNRQPIEWKGVAPNVAVPWAPRGFDTERDPLIDTAVGMLGELNGLFRVAPPAGIREDSSVPMPRRLQPFPR